MGFMDKAKKVVGGSKEEQTQQAVTEEAQAALSAHGKKIEDVLEVLQILPTFEIPPDVYMDVDMKDVHFDVQVPKGFDEGQVMYFVSQAKNSISFYLGLLRKRNEDVAKLASVIDKLQVDANNLRWEMEIANGVSIMPTMDDADLETQNVELRLEVKALEDKIRRLENSGGEPQAGGTTVPLAAYEKVADEVAALRARNQALEEANYELKTRIALQEDEEEDELSLDPSEPLSKEELEELGVVFRDQDDEDELALPAPVLGERPHEGVLPPPVEYDLTAYADEDGVSELDGMTLGGFGNNSDHDNNPRTLSVYDDDGDEDDESLEAMMKALRDM